MVSASPISALLVLDVADGPQFVGCIGTPPLAALREHPDWVVNALHGPIRIGSTTVTALMRGDWLGGFSFTRTRSAPTVPLRWSRSELPALRVVLDGECRVMASSASLGDLQSALEGAARGSVGEAFLWRGSWVAWQPLSGSRPGWLLDLIPARRACLPAFASLTRRQRQTCVLAARGRSVPQAADILGCTVETVRSHLKAAYRILVVSTRVELVEPLLEWEQWSRLDLPAS